MKVWRQGDVYLNRVKKIPREARKRPGRIVLHGELSGHAHRFEQGTELDMFVMDSGDPQRPGPVFFAEVRETSRLVHEEHGTIVLEPGCYRLWRQREYTPAAIVVVVD